MANIDAEKVINRLAAKVGELTAQIALLEAALEDATNDAEVRE